MEKETRKALQLIKYLLSHVQFKLYEEDIQKEIEEKYKELKEIIDE